MGYLAPLADNGGPTLTHALNEKSPAIDAGSCTNSSGITITVDQRDAARPQGNSCDIGAYESPYSTTVEIHHVELPLVSYRPAPCTHFNPACNVTSSPELHDSSPSWSPDGHRIVFARSESKTVAMGAEAGIYVMNVDGSALMRLSDHGYQPVWSPQGNKIAFTSLHDGMGDIYIMDVDGANQINLTASALRDDGKPIWSPDGAKTLYPSRANTSGDSDLYVMNADGSQKIMLAAKGRVSSSPWSPDSSKIVYDTYDIGMPFNIIGADGTNDTSISTGNIFHRMLVWSPDGSQLASSCTVQSIYAICVFKSDGSGTPLVFEHRGHDPLWSPDGNKLLSFNGQSFSTELLVMNVDGSNDRSLADVPFDTFLGDIVWSPDSRHIAYVLEKNGDYDIYVLEIEG
jgi:TolB protein